MSVSLWVWSSQSYAVLKRENKWRWPACQPYCLSVSSFMKFKAQCLRLIQVLHEQPKPLEQVTVLFHCDAPKSPRERPVRTTHDSLQLILAFLWSSALCTGLSYASGSVSPHSPRICCLYRVFSQKLQLKEDQQEWSPNGSKNISECKTRMCSGSLS